MFYSSYSQEKPQSRTGLRVLYIPATPSPGVSLWLATVTKRSQSCRNVPRDTFCLLARLSAVATNQSNQIKSRRGETGRDPMSAICLMSCCHRWTAGRQRAAEVLIISIHSIQWNAIRLNCPGAIANATAAVAAAATAAVAHCTHLQSADWIDIDILHR